MIYVYNVCKLIGYQAGIRTIQCNQCLLIKLQFFYRICSQSGKGQLANGIKLSQVYTPPLLAVAKQIIDVMYAVNKKGPKINDQKSCGYFLIFTRDYSYIINMYLLLSKLMNFLKQDFLNSKSIMQFICNWKNQLGNAPNSRRDILVSIQALPIHVVFSVVIVDICKPGFF